MLRYSQRHLHLGVLELKIGWRGSIMDVELISRAESVLLIELFGCGLASIMTVRCWQLGGPSGDIENAINTKVYPSLTAIPIFLFIWNFSVIFNYSRTPLEQWGVHAGLRSPFPLYSFCKPGWNSNQPDSFAPRGAKALLLRDFIFQVLHLLTQIDPETDLVIELKFSCKSLASLLHIFIDFVVLRERPIYQDSVPENPNGQKVLDIEAMAVSQMSKPCTPPQAFPNPQ